MEEKSANLGRDKIPQFPGANKHVSAKENIRNISTQLSPKDIRVTWVMSTISSLLSLHDDRFPQRYSNLQPRGRIHYIIWRVEKLLRINKTGEIRVFLSFLNKYKGREKGIR